MSRRNNAREKEKWLSNEQKAGRGERQTRRAKQAVDPSDTLFTSPLSPLVSVPLLLPSILIMPHSTPMPIKPCRKSVSCTKQAFFSSTAIQLRLSCTAFCGLLNEGLLNQALDSSLCLSVLFICESKQEHFILNMLYTIGF